MEISVYVWLTGFARCAVELFSPNRQRIYCGGFLKAFHLPNGGRMISWRRRWTLWFLLFTYCYMTFHSRSGPWCWFAFQIAWLTAQTNRMKRKWKQGRMIFVVNIIRCGYFFLENLWNLLHCFSISAKKIRTYSVFVQ